MRAGVAAVSGAVALTVVATVAGRAMAFDPIPAQKRAQAILDGAERFAAFDKQQMGAFWNCLMSGEVDVGMFQNADQIQQRMEAANFTQQKTYSDHLLNECLPMLAAAQEAAGSLKRGMPDVLMPSLQRYLAALVPMRAGLATYAGKLKARGQVKDVDRIIQDVAVAFTTDPTPESIAFEKFMVCAIPGLDQKEDIQGVLEYMADTCKKDAAVFMDRVHSKCAPLVQNLDRRAKPSKTFKVNAGKFYEEDQRQVQAWEYCGKKARKGKTLEDLQPFMTAAGDHLEARGALVTRARAEVARLTGRSSPDGGANPPAAAPAPPPAKK